MEIRCCSEMESASFHLSTLSSPPLRANRESSSKMDKAPTTARNKEKKAAILEPPITSKYLHALRQKAAISRCSIDDMKLWPKKLLRMFKALIASIATTGAN